MMPDPLHPSPPEKVRTDRDLEDYEELPEQQKELHRLQDLAEKTSGPKQAELNRLIRRESRDEKP